jgi:uncharacterized protein (TIGR00255 family)
VQAGLSVQHEAGASRVRINEQALAEVLATMQAIAKLTQTQPPTADGILAVRGVLETVDSEPDEASRAALTGGILADLDKAVEALAAARAREGAATAAALTARLDEMQTLVGAAEASPARKPETIRARLAEQIAALLDAAPALDPDRLHQEAALLATRADIREELDRLTAHIAAARDLLAANAPAGRRLDFLAQEFNREVNTLCAKANDRGLTAIGLDMKAVVDQLREQVQNVE